MNIFFPPTPQWPAWPKLPPHPPPTRTHGKSRSARTGTRVHPFSVEAFFNLKKEGHSRAKRHHLTCQVFTIQHTTDTGILSTMPIRPLPSVYTCPKCGWTKSVAPRSDALMPGEYFSKCPACGCGTLTHRNASQKNPLLEQMNSMLDFFKSQGNR